MYFSLVSNLIQVNNNYFLAFVLVFMNDNTTATNFLFILILFYVPVAHWFRTWHAGKK